jgi:phosphoenolpyruvate carboxylase
MLIFADASATDNCAVGKFIISMCQNVSDILVMMVLMRLSGLLTVDEKGEIKSEHDVTGLFETIHDLDLAPRIIEDLLRIDSIRQHIINEVSIVRILCLYAVLA